MSLSYTDLAVAVAEADAYAQPRGWSEWAAAASGDKDAALRRGQDFIAGSYNARWLDEWANDDAPENVKFAIIEAAIRQLAKPGSLAPDVTLTGQASRKKVKAGPVETETQFAEARSASDALPVIVTIDRLLAGLLRPAAGGSVDLLRV